MKNLLQRTLVAIALLVALPASATELPVLNVHRNAAPMALSQGGTVVRTVGSFVSVKYPSIEQANKVLTVLKSRGSIVSQDMTCNIPEPVTRPWGGPSIHTASAPTQSRTASFAHYQWMHKAMLSVSAQPGKRKVKFGVIDSGIDLNHPALDVVRSWSIDGASTPAADHGTHVAGIVAANPNKGDVRGIAYGAVSIYSYCVGTGGGMLTDSTIAAGLIKAADDGVQIVNVSIGRPIYDMPSPVMEEAVRYATGKGVLVVTAAGNSSADQAQFIPSSYSLTNPMVISVAAGASDGHAAFFSNYGTLDAAPGYQIISTIPRGYADYSGTSMASPAWAATAALLRYNYPSWSNTRIIERIRETAESVKSLNGEFLRSPNIARALGMKVPAGLFGTVINATERTQSGNNLGAVTVTITRGSSVLSRGKTDASGCFSIQLTPGSYTVTFRKSGFHQTSKSVTVGGNQITNLGNIELFPVPGNGRMYVAVRHNTRHATFSTDELHVPVGTAFDTKLEVSGEDPVGDFGYWPGTPLDGKAWLRRTAFEDEIALSTFEIDRSAESVTMEIRNLHWSLIQPEYGMYIEAGTNIAVSGLTLLVVDQTGIREFRPTITMYDTFDATWPIVINTVTGEVAIGELYIPEEE